MNHICNDMMFDAATENYLQELLMKLEQTLKEELFGVHLSGSIALGDYRPEGSDIDVLVVSKGMLNDDHRRQLVKRLSHETFNCPALGLDLCVVHVDSVTSTLHSGTYEFAISTGKQWELKIENGGEEKELLLDFAICRRFGRALSGPYPTELFAEVPRKVLLEIMADIIKWHRSHLLHPFHDPLGHFAVLNACRAWKYGETQELCSKTAGGQWVLTFEPENGVVTEALAVRREGRKTELQEGEINSFLQRVSSALTR